MALEPRDRLRRQREGELAAGIDGDLALVPAGRTALRLVDGQGVEEFVGEHDRRARRHLGERRVPAHRHVAGVAQRVRLALPQGGAHLDEMHAQRPAEFGRGAGGADRIEHHGAAAGPDLDELEHGGRADLLPHFGGPQSDHLAEHLAHFRRGDEVAGGAERVAAQVIAVIGIVEAERHERRDRHRPVAGDAGADHRIERRAFGAHDECSGLRRSAKAANPAPAMNSGMHSTMPMVMWPHRKPSCGSGSRKNSQNERNTA